MDGTRKNILDEVTHIQKHRYSIYSLTIGDVKQRITTLQSTTIENLDNKEDQKKKKRHTWIQLGTRKRQDLRSKFGATRFHITSKPYQRSCW